MSVLMPQPFAGKHNTFLRNYIGGGERLCVCVREEERERVCVCVRENVCVLAQLRCCMVVWVGG